MCRTWYLTSRPSLTFFQGSEHVDSEYTTRFLRQRGNTANTKDYTYPAKSDALEANLLDYTYPAKSDANL